MQGGRLKAAAIRLPFLFEAGARSAGEFLLIRCRTSGSRRPLAAITKLTDVYLQFVNRAAESVAVHSELPRRATLIALILLKDSRDESALEFADRFRIKNITAIHLLYERFKLIFHGFPFSLVSPKVSSLDIVVQPRLLTLRLL
jgi:hypothetical protein